MTELTKRIKQRRKSQNKTLLEVAEFVGVKEATIQRYESGDIKTIPYKNIELIAQCLNCSPAYLMGWEDDIASLSDDELDSRIIEVFDRLSEEKQKQALDYMNFLASQD